jgi:hypothetical protein
LLLCCALVFLLLEDKLKSSKRQDKEREEEKYRERELAHVTMRWQRCCFFLCLHH